ncbi:uncharacterized protein ANIA_11050 [Aspergillus nidulans FGSC A4]|uniref:N-acetyl-D-glucosamine kinase n=1 Tax=Emericella nidulans (strain FGSC A4 / ATCC 38163 / CBS 112.46 / NRRL 194 / M139) TaxID=227321 RepID=C8V6N7_EMENI|nr:hypothetical protein [Aspergillus nidulans FGSC A4]CBF73937.1 TPA: hypothetical protein ANIA_11050 [Aspergillus nidulans FGSC A4]
MTTLSAAIENAMQNARETYTPEQPELPPVTNKQPVGLVLSQFSKAWIALAGLDRPGLRDRIEPKIAAVLGRPSVLLRLTNDVDLLAAAMTQHPEVPSAVVLIAGTGSVAMRYTITEPGQVPTRTARSGGWGHLLGDEGGGYSIGLEAIKHTLTAILQRFGGSQSTSPSSSSSSGGNMGPDLLSEVLLGQRGESASVKSRIAAAAQLVVNLAPEDATAMTIVTSQVKALVDTVLGRLIDPRSQSAVAPERTGLILSGGVLRHELYRELVLERLTERGIKFAYTETVMDAGALGAKSLCIACD